MTGARPFHLPEIRSVQLESFDLYRANPNPSVTIDRPVLCLVGANGLGKSTFLNTLNYAITGAIPDPKREYKSPEEYYTDSTRGDRIDDYFSGRVSELRRDIATVTVELVWPHLTLIATRQIFQRGISALTISDASGSQTLTRSDMDNLTDRYERAVLEASRMPSFDRFVFLYHFVFTFDESRHLISWDDRAVTDALYLAFGGAGDAGQSAKLTRDMERASSRARNTRFMAKTITDRIKQLQDVLKNAEPEPDDQRELLAKRDALEKAQSLAETRVDQLDRDRQNADLRWTEISSRISDLQSQYRQIFAGRRVAQSSIVSFHPAIKASIDEDECAVCHHAGVAAHLSAHLSRGECPLCGSPIEQDKEDEKVLDQLKIIDTELLKLRGDLEAVLAERSRLELARASAEADFTAAGQALEAFLSDAGDAIDPEQLKGKDWLEGEIAKNMDERARLLKQAEAHRRARDDIRDELRKLERQLQVGFDEASEVFVPRFRNLAEAFIGLPIDIELETRTGVEAAGFRVKLTMNDQLRSSDQRLSESQRFFIDIALRMAMSEALTENRATLLVDTPEGSLDIAYEAKAGQMFHNFADGGNTIIMTANLRSSALLKNLASLSGSDGMQLVRMTDWAELSEVQMAEQARLDEAFDEIKDELA